MYKFFCPRQMIYFNGYSAHILDFKQGDINGDGYIDNIFLMGDKPYEMQSPFVTNINLVVQDGFTREYIRVPIKEGSGYNPTIFPGDFTGDRVDDIVVYIDSGGSGAMLYSYIYSFIDNKPKLLFDFETFNEDYKYQVNYRDNYKVEVISERTDTMYTIDIQYKGEEYLWEIYDKNGRLKEPIEGFVNPISGLYPIDFERDGVYELRAVQKIAGRYNADAIGYVETDLKWDGREFKTWRQQVAIFGEDVKFV
ncbi:VCBS repeat-containing protein [Clostridium thermarum]|uniref:VCBS repeat-containing protein n=1 Tax=Clostridium thermarum TaxID=1716543 RepID=UPI0013D79E66|nr:VCBS repeat-containing protein [Clostridium thermarum]